MHFDVVEADATQTAADVLVLKYAQHHYGLDEVVAGRLQRVGRHDNEMAPEPESFRLLTSPPDVVAAEILFVGV
jgi:hypothetical protein